MLDFIHLYPSKKEVDDLEMVVMNILVIIFVLVVVIVTRTSVYVCVCPGTREKQEMILH